MVFGKDRKEGEIGDKGRIGERKIGEKKGHRLQTQRAPEPRDEPGRRAQGVPVPSLQISRSLRLSKS